MPQKIYLFDSCEKEDFSSLASKLNTYSHNQDSLLRALSLCPEESRKKHEEIIQKITESGKIKETAETRNYLFFLMETGKIFRLKPKTHEIEAPSDNNQNSTNNTSNTQNSNSNNRLTNTASLTSALIDATLNSLTNPTTLTRRNAQRRGRGRGVVRGRGRGGFRGRGRGGHSSRPTQSMLEAVSEAHIEIVELVVQNMFTRDQIRNALVRSSMNPDAAINLLFDGGDGGDNEDEDDDEDEDDLEDYFEDEEEEEDDYDEDDESENEQNNQNDQNDAPDSDSDVEQNTTVPVSTLVVAPTVIDESESKNDKKDEKIEKTETSTPKKSLKENLINSVQPVSSLTLFDEISTVKSDSIYKSITALASDLVALSDYTLDLITETDAENSILTPITKYSIESLNFENKTLQEIITLPNSPSSSSPNPPTFTTPSFNYLCSSESLCFFTTSNHFYGIFTDRNLTEKIPVPDKLKKLPSDVVEDFQHCEVKHLNALVYTNKKGVFSFGYEPHIRLMPDSCSNASSQDEEQTNSSSQATNNLFSSEELRDIRRQAMQEVYGDPDYSDEYSEDEDSEAEEEIVRAIERIKKDKSTVKFKVGSLVTKSAGVIYPAKTKCFYDGLVYELSQNFNKSSVGRNEEVKLTPGNKTVSSEIVTFLDSRIVNSAEDGTIVALNGPNACVQYLNNEYKIVPVKELKPRIAKPADTEN